MPPEPERQSIDVLQQDLGKPPEAAFAAFDVSQSMHMTMMKGMKDMEARPMSGDVDRDFAAIMRMHHQQAIDMAREQMGHGEDPPVQAMASKSVEDQAKEVKQVDDWLAKRKR